MPTTTAADGTRLAYQVCESNESNAPTLVFCNGIACTDSYWQPMLGHFKGRARMVTWDYKGHGASEAAKSPESTRIPALADDLFRVMDAAEVDGPAVLLGFSMGCQLILEAFRQDADRIAALVPCLGSYGRPFDSLLHPALGPRLFRIYSSFGRRRHRLLLRAGWLASRNRLFHDMNRLISMVGRDLPRDQMLPFYDHMRQLDPRTWSWMLPHMQAHTAEDILDEIDVPALVVVGHRDLFTPPERGRTMAQRIPDARLVELPHGTHAGLLDQADTVIEEVERFLHRQNMLRSIP